jgi:hypothetical protein
VGVAERGAQQPALLADALVLRVDEREEPVDMRPQELRAERFDLGRWPILPRALKREDPRDAREALAGDRVLGDDRRFPPLGPRVAPAPDLAPERALGLAVVAPPRESGGRYRKS